MKITTTQDGYLLAKGNERFKINIEDAISFAERIKHDQDVLLSDVVKYFNPEA